MQVEFYETAKEIPRQRTISMKIHLIRNTIKFSTKHEFLLGPASLAKGKIDEE